jgi:hypothetical protein
MTTDAFEYSFPLSAPPVMERREPSKHWRSHRKMQMGVLYQQTLIPPPVIAKELHDTTKFTASKKETPQHTIKASG